MLTMGKKNVLKSVDILIRWKYYRDSHYSLYEVTNDIKGYKKSIKLYQTIIKVVMKESKKDLINTLLYLNDKEEDVKVKLKFICAGYDLINGNDYTI